MKYTFNKRNKHFLKSNIDVLKFTNQFERIMFLFNITKYRFLGPIYEKNGKSRDKENTLHLSEFKYRLQFNKYQHRL